MGTPESNTDWAEDPRVARRASIVSGDVSDEDSNVALILEMKSPSSLLLSLDSSQSVMVVVDTASAAE